jgi:hypothetical protein
MFTVAAPRNHSTTVGEYSVSLVSIDDHHEVAVRRDGEQWETMFASTLRGPASAAYRAAVAMIGSGAWDDGIVMLRWNGREIVAVR